MSEKVHQVFYANARAAVDEMRAAGMHEAAIAGAVADIRAAAIHEERLRVDIVARSNPPQFPTWVEVMNALSSQQGGDHG